MYRKAIHILTVLVIVLGVVTSAFGIFYSNGGTPFDVVNQFGDSVRIYGDGIYAHDTYFSAPIFKGTDTAILFFAVPLLIFALAADVKKKSFKSRVFLLSVLSVFVYYAYGLALGVIYNQLHLVYTALFSVSLFALILAFVSLDYSELGEELGRIGKFGAYYFFLGLTAAFLFLAWMPDIITALLKNRPPEIIEVYTTVVTYLIDMGVISPVAVLAIVLIKKRRGMGYAILNSMLTLCAVVGVIIPLQTCFQYYAGVDLPLGAMITKAGTFVALAVFAAVLQLRLLLKKRGI